jgi:hypothetical protein
MATQDAKYFGVDLACVIDADELFSEVSGEALLIQDSIHRLTTDAVLGPGGDDWGYDCRRLIGASNEELERMQPTLSEVLSRDDRVISADVTLSSVAHNGMSDMSVDVTLHTALGPFSFTRTLSQMTALDLENL